jgi:hypothetical protein
MQSRRIFLGSTAALAGGGSLLLLSSRAVAQAPAALPDDPVWSAIVAQFERATQAFQAGPTTGEASRQLAAAFRMAAAWGRANRIDDTVRARLRSRVAREGRDAMILRPFDAVDELRLRGLTAPHPVALATVADKSRALDAMLRGGVTRHWAECADRFEAAAERLDRVLAGVVRVRQQTADEHEDMCERQRSFLLLLEAQMAFWCAPWWAGFLEMCIVASAGYFAWLLSMAWDGCL